MFTADNVLGLGTAVFNDLTAYLNSLERMKAANPGRLYCGHGNIIENGKETLGQYIKHRMIRVEQCSALLKTGGADKQWTSEEITRAIYIDTPEHLIRPAMGNTILVLKKLASDGLIELQGADALSGAWHLVGGKL